MLRWDSEQPGDNIIFEVNKVEFHVSRATFEGCCRFAVATAN